jgi:hypothetical protein
VSRANVATACGRRSQPLPFLNPVRCSAQSPLRLRVVLAKPMVNYLKGIVLRSLKTKGVPNGRHRLLHNDRAPRSGRGLWSRQQRQAKTGCFKLAKEGPDRLCRCNCALPVAVGGGNTDLARFAAPLMSMTRCSAGIARRHCQSRRTAPEPGERLRTACVLSRDVISRDVIARRAATKQSGLDCFAEPVLGRRGAPTRGLAMTRNLGVEDAGSRTRRRHESL